ncbi:MAG TPA: VWA domain-containing protein [Thermoanaerobaculia bacterium]
MGYGNYSQDAHEALLRGRQALPTQHVFQQQDCHPLMNPKGARVRESRDSAEHPQTLGVVFALDVTGSMGDIPELMARQQLPHFMKVLTDCKVPDPQLLFMAVGDATSDRSPLQVGQFESTAELMDQWLTWCHLEGGGGGGGQESYELALYFLAQHTEMDCWVKRRKRGYLFMTGDEKPYPILSRHVVEAVIGDRLDDDIKVEEVLALLQETFVPFFIIPDRDRRNRQRCERAWRDLLGDHVLCMEAPADVCFVAAGALLLSEGLVADLQALEAALLASGMPQYRKATVIKTLRPLAGVQDVKKSGWRFWR